MSRAFRPCLARDRRDVSHGPAQWGAPSHHPAPACSKASFPENPWPSPRNPTPPDRYTPDPSVMTALRSPRILTREVLAGLVVAMALIPEAISFSIIAGVDPRVGLFSSFVMAVSIAFLGGSPRHDHRGDRRRRAGDRPGRCASTAWSTSSPRSSSPASSRWSSALLGVAKLMRFIPRSVMVGFVNALAILIFAAQLPQLHRCAVARLPARRGRHRDHGADAALHQGRAGAARGDRADHRRSSWSPA